MRAGLDHVAGPALHVDVPLGVDMPQVSGAQPAVDEHLLRELPVPPVSLHDVGASRADLARRERRQALAPRIPDLDPDTVDRDAHRAGLAVEVLRRQVGQARSGLCLAVHHVQRRRRQRLAQPRDPLRAHGSARLRHVPEGSQIVVLEAGPREQQGVGRRHAREARHALCGDSLENPVRVHQGALEHQTRADGQVRMQQGGAIGVIERQHHAHALRRREPEIPEYGIHVGREIAVTQRNALRRARGARRVHQRGRVAFAETRGSGRRAGVHVENLGQDRLAVPGMDVL